MAKFIVKLTTYLVVDEPYWKNLDDAENALDIGSRCFEECRVQQWMREIDEAVEGYKCNCYRFNQEIIKIVPDNYPELPIWDDIYPC